MNIEVKFNENGEPIRAEVKSSDLTGARFSIDGGAATLSSIAPIEGNERVHGEEIRQAMIWVEELEFVDEAQLPGGFELEER